MPSINILKDSESAPNSDASSHSVQTFHLYLSFSFYSVFVDSVNLINTNNTFASIRVVSLFPNLHLYNLTLCNRVELTTQNATVQIKCSLLIYKQILRHLITFACPIRSKCARSHLNKIQVFQNKIIFTVRNAT
jgi:hypothetical protein